MCTCCSLNNEILLFLQTVDTQVNIAIAIASCQFLKLCSLYYQNMAICFCSMLNISINSISYLSAVAVIILCVTVYILQPGCSLTIQFVFRLTSFVHLTTVVIIHHLKPVVVALIFVIGV